MTDGLVVVTSRPRLDDNNNAPLAPDIDYRKIIIVDYRNFKTVHIDKSTGNRIVTGYNVRVRDGMKYQNISALPSIEMYYQPGTGFYIHVWWIKVITKNNQGFRTIPEAYLNHPNSGTTPLPVIVHVDGEQPTDETATRTISIPFDEEPIWLFQDIMFRRLYSITRKFLDGLNAERVALLTKVDQLAGGVGDDEDHRRYDHAANLGRGLIGYTWEQINILSDDTLPASKKKTRAEIETLIDKLEATFPDQHAIDKFFVRHDEVNWQDVRQNRQIRLVGDDYRPGEILKNINEEHLKTKNGVTAVDQVSAENEYARCVKQCFRSAWSDRRDRYRHTFQYSLGIGDSAATVPKSQLDDESLLA